MVSGDTSGTPKGSTWGAHFPYARGTYELGSRGVGEQLAVQDSAKRAVYQEVRASIGAVLEGEADWIAGMATTCSILHGAFEHYDWTGFYRAVGSELVLGPFQGSSACLRIPYAKGVCGAAARTRTAQRVDDVHAFPGHIACSATTQSELVVPVVSPQGTLLAVLDVDSNQPAAFSTVDQDELEILCDDLGKRFAVASPER